MRTATKRATAIEQQFALEVFKKVVLTRVVDEKTAILAKQNKGGTFHLCHKGHELIGVVGGALLKNPENIGFPYYRDRGFPIGKGCKSQDLLTSFIARATPLHSGGRMMPDHYSDRENGVICQSSVVASQILHAVGAAKSIQLSKGSGVVYVSMGDGASSQGDFHEALNFAAIHKLPVIFCVQDNGWAISVPQKEQTAGGSVEKVASGYEGLSVYSVDGCDFEEVFEAYTACIERASTGPSIIVAKVPRMGSHSSSDDPKLYKSDACFLEDQRRDPLLLLREFLIESGFATEDEIEKITEEIKRVVDEEALLAEEAPLPRSVTNEDAFAPAPMIAATLNEGSEEIVMATAINRALKEEMERDEDLVVFGQDVARGKGGVFKITENLTALFGEGRCFNTPLAESLIMGLALGMSVGGRHRCVAEIQFADYIWTGVNQLFNEIASFYFRSNGMWSVPIVIRMPCGGYIQGGPYHSQSIEGVLSHIPGLKVVMPSNANDAKRLLKAAIRDPNPVIFLEHKALYRQRTFAARFESGIEDLFPIGKAQIVRSGETMTIVCWGMMVMIVSDIVAELDLSIEVIDLCTIVPWDKETVLASVRKTGKALIVQEAVLESGFGAEVAAVIAEEAFTSLDAPIRRIGALKLPVPYAKELETEVLPSRAQIKKVIEELYRY